MHLIGGTPALKHEIIWAPWRLGYILGEDETPDQDESLGLSPGGRHDCFLCRCVPEQGDDRKRLVVYRSEQTISVLNRYPYNNGHILVAPRSHRGRLDELGPEQQLGVAAAITHMVGLLERVLRADGFNVGLNLGRVAGAGLPGHLHWHVVPRWAGDTNFMPATAAVRIIPQSLEALWELLRAELTKGVVCDE